MSKYRGFVTDNTDDAQLGRVTVIVPSITSSPLNVKAMPKSTVNGTTHGKLEIPDIGSKVWVEFEQDNFRYPIYSPATFETDISKLAEHVYEEEVPRGKIYKTKSGHLKFWEKEGETYVELLGEALTSTDGVLNYKNPSGSLVINNETVTLTKMETETPSENPTPIIKSEAVFSNSDIKIKLNTDNPVVVEIKDDTVNVIANNISLTKEGASKSFILGEDFMTWINEQINMAINLHKHVGNNGAPTSPPIEQVVPMDIALLSEKIKGE